MDRRHLLTAMAAMGIIPRFAAAKMITRSPTLKMAGDEIQRVFQPYRDMGGVLAFAVYEGSEDARGDSLALIHEAFGNFGKINESEFNTLEARQISDAKFFGDWYDEADQSLVKVGTFTTAAGRTLTNPKLRSLEQVKIVSGGSPGVDIGAGGQFAYAYLNPPYGLAGSPDDIQETFDRIRAVILPEGHAARILDWTNPELDKVSDYFQAGKEWWGIFLFSIYIPDIQRLTIIAGSATD